MNGKTCHQHTAISLAMACKSQTSNARGEIPITSQNDAGGDIPITSEADVGGEIPITSENGKTGTQAGLVRIKQVKRSHMKRLAEKPASEGRSTPQAPINL